MEKSNNNNKTKEQFTKESLDFWQKKAKSFQGQSMRVTPLYITLLNFVKIEQSKKILEIGCGPATLLHHMLTRKDPSAQLTISDFSTEMLSYAAFKAKSYLEDPYKAVFIQTGPVDKFEKDQHFEKFNLTIRQLDAEDLSSIPNGSVDTYLASLVFQLVSNYKQAMKESYRVLSNKGKCMFTVWGRLEKSELQNIPVSILASYNIQVPQGTLKFQLGDREKMIKDMEEIGYKNVISWYQHVAFDLFSEQDIDKIVNEQMSLKSLINLASPNQQGEIAAKMKQQMLKCIHTDKNPIGMEYMYVYGEKE